MRTLPLWSIILCAATAPFLASCALKTPSIRYRVEGVIPETWSAGPFRAVEAAEILDAQADSAVPRRYGNLIKSSTYSEQVEVLRSLFQDQQSPYAFRRVAETSRSLRSMRGLGYWVGEDTMRHVKRVVMESTITRDRTVQNLPLVERTLNYANDVDDEYESLRRAVVLDSQMLRKSHSDSSSARFWFCARSAEARSLSISLFSKNGPFTDDVVERVRTTAEAWIHERSIDARVAECKSLSAGDSLFLRLEGSIGIRVEMLPIIASRDGTLSLIADPSINVDRVYQ